MIGMGAFAHENVRLFVEHKGKMIQNIARHVNLMMPRMVSWWVNQSTTPITAAHILKRMEPMYKLIGVDPWSISSVTATDNHSLATIRQETRWGVSDIYFLALYFGKA